MILYESIIKCIKLVEDVSIDYSTKNVSSRLRQGKNDTNLGLTTKSTALFFKNPPMCFAYVCNSHNASHHAFASVVTT